MSVVIWALLKLSPKIQLYIAGGAAILTAISGIQYLYDAARQLSSSPRSAATPGQ
jgi:phosphatidylglycerophosphate synthase